MSEELEMEVEGGTEEDAEFKVYFEPLYAPVIEQRGGGLSGPKSN